ncbi:MAG: VaFE repeat-containing surface-anchored protein, partial [Lachnospiraceae bacterium]|nr:VaFE repeat-containing surface-anchored protein [Lachnospiraceae bacterium]
PDLDALPYGDYLLEEMKTERTRSMKMLKKEFSVSKKAAQIDLGTLENEEIRIATIARDERTGSHTASAEENTVLTDEVRMEGLEKGRKYSLSGIVLLKGEDGMSELLDAEGNPVHADLTFTASEKNMTEEVRFLIDARELAGKKLVIYEELRTADDDAFAAAHKDPLDEQQMISFPVIGTKAQTEEGNSYIQEGSESVLIDTVSYSGLIPQESYDLTASLVYKADGEPVLVDGEPVTAHKTFVPENASGSVEIRFTVDTAFLRPEPVVVFESLEVGGVELCIHADLEDEAQTLMYARIETQASCIMTQTQNAPADAACQLTDTVSYEGLKPGRQYDLICMLLDTESGEFLLLNGAETERRQRFTAADAEEGAYSACGSVDVEFTADTAALAGRTLAVYEKLYDGEILVASHCDEDAAEQQILIPAIATKALGKESGEQQICAEENQAITDTVSCENLIPGSEYLLKGRIVLREESGTHEEGQEGGTSRWSEPFEDPVCAEKYFTAEESAQEVTMDFEIDASLLEDQTLVVFEGLYLNDVLIASHCDPDAQEQSITVVKKQEETTEASSEESSEETTEESSEEPSEEPTEKTTEESSEELTTEESTPEESTPEESTPESNSEESTVPSTSPSEKQSTPENTTAPTSKTTPESTEPAVIITDDPGKPAVYLAIGVTSLVVLSAAALLYVLISSRKKDGGKRERG